MTKRVFRYDKATGKVVEVKPEPVNLVWEFRDGRKMIVRKLHGPNPLGLPAIHVKGAKTIGRLK